MYAFFIGLFNKIIAGLGFVLSAILSVFPDSPFQKYLQTYSISKWIGYINYFVPVSAIVDTLSAWTAAIAVYYIYQIVSRWIKLSN